VKDELDGSNITDVDPTNDTGASTNGPVWVASVVRGS
jgi:hypothetical protein